MKKLTYICYGIFFLAFATQLWYAMSDTLTFTTIQKVAVIALQMSMLILGTIANTKTLSENDKRKDVRFAQTIVFLLFLGNLAYLLFFDKDFGRTNHAVGYTLWEYFDANVNLVPFDTINLYLDGYRSGSFTWGAMMINIVGNMIAFIPFAYFLPLFFKMQRHIFVFMITMLFIILGVEVLQVVMQSGSGDIDDVILNVIGVLSVYIICKIPFIQHWIFPDTEN